jgi:DNA-binding response OmpR family regulator
MPRLLVADDEPRVREVAREYFSLKGFEVLVAATGVQGLRRLREDRPHAVLLDVLLPDTDGLDVLREAKARDPALSVVMLTGVLDETIGRLAFQRGAVDYVTKPVDLEYLERVVWYMLMRTTIG